MVRAPEAGPVRQPPGGHAVAPAGEQSRARYPDRTGYAEADGVRSFYEVYGTGEPTILFAPTWTIVTSRIWKPQIPYFARRHRVVTFDPRGTGRSDRPESAAAYGEAEFGKDILAVMDAAGGERAVVVSLSDGAERALVATAAAPHRIAGLVFTGPSVPLGERVPDRVIDFEAELPGEGWARYNRHSWRRDYRGFLEFFFGKCFTEPHSTKQIEDAVGWGLETDGETLIRTHDSPELSLAYVEGLCRSVRCPSLVIQGLEDAISGPSRGLALAAAIPGARLVTIAGGGHIPNARDPVLVNLLIRDFLRSVDGSNDATR